MKLKTIGIGSLYSIMAIAGTLYLTAQASEDSAAPQLVTGPTVAIDARTIDIAPPTGVPSELHRKVMHLYKRIHNAYPDASRQRVFNKIAEELGINPQRLWNAYHSGSGGRVDIYPTDRVVDRKVDQRTDRQVDRTTDRVVDRVTDRPVRVDSVRTDRVLRDRVVRARPQRD